MDKNEQRRRSALTKRVRLGTVGMSIRASYSQVLYIDPKGNPVYEAIATDRFGVRLETIVWKAASNIKRKWYVSINVLWRNKESDCDKLDTSEFEVDNVRLDDLGPVFLSEKHSLMNEVGRENIIDVFWTAKTLT